MCVCAAKKQQLVFELYFSRTQAPLAHKPPTRTRARTHELTHSLTELFSRDDLEFIVAPTLNSPQHCSFGTLCNSMSVDVNDEVTPLKHNHVTAAAVTAAAAAAAAAAARSGCGSRLTGDLQVELGAVHRQASRALCSARCVHLPPCRRGVFVFYSSLSSYFRQFRADSDIPY